MEPSVQVKQEVVEYGLVPVNLILPQLDQANLLVELHRRLVQASTYAADGQRTVSLPAVAEILEVQDEQLIFLSEILDALALRPLAASTPQALQQLDVYELTLFLFILSAGRELVRQEANDHWPEAAGPTQIECFSPTRGFAKAGTKNQRQSSQKQHRQYLQNLGDYVRRNVRRLVTFVLDSLPPSDTDLATADGFIRAKELDRLAFVLDWTGMSKPPSDQGLVEDFRTSLSACTGLFEEGGAVPLEGVVEWLAGHWCEEPLESPRSTALSNGAMSMRLNPQLGICAQDGMVDERSVVGVVKGTVVRGEKDFPAGEVQVLDCHDTVIYVLAPLKRALLRNCSECTVVLGAVGALLRVEKCEKMRVMATAARTAIVSCHESTFFLGVNRAPLLLGDNRFLVLAPFNTRYERLIAHMSAAGVSLEGPSRWDVPLVLQRRERRVSASGSPYAAPNRMPYVLMAPEEFMPFVVPFRGVAGPIAGGPASQLSTRWTQPSQRALQQHGGGSAALLAYPFPLPLEYDQALQAKYAVVNDLRTKIKQTALDDARKRELQLVIQAYFKEWLNGSAHIHEVYDLAKLETEENAAATAAASSAGGAV